MKHQLSVYIATKDPGEPRDEEALILSEIIMRALDGIPWVIDHGISEDSNASSAEGSEVQASSGGPPDYGGEEAQCKIHD